MTTNFMKKAVLCVAALLLCCLTILAAMPINVGVALPLHNDDGDGKRAIEYYRGLILAAEELKTEGVEVNFFAWNCHINAGMASILKDANAKKCDIFFGPMYSKQVATLQAFAAKQNAKVIIPFSISGDPASQYSNVFQIYQEPQFARMEAIKKFAEKYSNCQVIIVGCNDSETTKGDFTAELRGLLTGKGLTYHLTNLTTNDELFIKAFSKEKQNIIVLNSASNKSLKEAFKKLANIKKLYPEVKFSMFGYTEWLTFANDYAPFYHKFDVIIPTHSYFNPYNADTKKFISKYNEKFGVDLLSQYNPRFGIMGYDHGRFLFRGFSKMGKDYKGMYANNDALQTRIYFGKVGQTGGMQNIGFKFVHYNQNQTITIENY